MAFGLEGLDDFQRIQADRPIHPAVVLDAPLAVASHHGRLAKYREAA